MQGDRVFDEEYLVSAGVLTVDLIERSLQLESTAQAGLLEDRFQQEIFTMYYSYEGWEKAILEELTVLGGEAMSQQALAAIEDISIAPERIIAFEGLVDQWAQRFAQIETALEQADYQVVHTNCCSLHQEALAVHDGMMSRVTALLSILYKEYGDEILMKVLQAVMRPELMDPDGTLPFKEKVEKIIHFTRSHLQAFRVVEDDEKVTFFLTPVQAAAG